MWRAQTLLPALCILLPSPPSMSQVPAVLMDLHTSSHSPGPGNVSLDCIISSDGLLNIRSLAWQDPEGTELCKVTDSQPVSGPCKYVPQKQLTLDLENVPLERLVNYSCTIKSNRGIKTVPAEALIVPDVQIFAEVVPTAKQSRDASGSLCDRGLAWAMVLVGLILM